MHIRMFKGTDSVAYTSKMRPNFTFFSFSKFLVVVLGPIIVYELVSVENAPSAPLRSTPGFR